MNCPNCKYTEMKIVFFEYMNGKVIQDGKERYLCERCGYQRLVKEIDKSEWKTKNPRLFEYDSNNGNGIVDIFVKEDPACPFPFHEEDWWHQGFYLENFITYLRDFFRRNNIQYKVINDELDEISVMIRRWENTLCPDCGAPMKIVMGYFQKCSVKPDEHTLCDSEFYLKKIKEVIEKIE